MLVGLGAVSTTTIAGVHRDPPWPRETDWIADPDGHRPSRQTHRGELARRSRISSRSPRWTTSCSAAGTSSTTTATRRRRPPACSTRICSTRSSPSSKQIRPWPAVFDQPLREAARRAQRQEGQEQARSRRPGARRHPEIQEGQRPEPPGDGLGGSTEVFLTESPVHATIEAFEKGLEASDDNIPSSMIYAYAAIKEGIPYANAAPNLSADVPALHPARAADRLADVRQGSQDRPDADQDDHRARPEGAADRRRGLVLHQHPRQPRRRSARRSGVVQDQGGEQEVGARLHPAAGRSIPICTKTSATSSASTTTRRAATTKRAGTTSTSSAGSATRCS